MKALTTLLATVALLALLVAAPATAQTTNAACQDIQDRLNAGDNTLTSAELLSCGLSPEAISPCEGSTDPNCDNTGYPSIGGPNGVGTNNECSDLPEGSAEAIECYEALIAAGSSASASASASASVAADDAQYSPDASVPAEPEITELPATGGASLLALGSGVLLVIGCLLARRVVRS